MEQKKKVGLGWIGLSSLCDQIQTSFFHSATIIVTLTNFALLTKPLEQPMTMLIWGSTCLEMRVNDLTVGLVLWQGWFTNMVSLFCRPPYGLKGNCPVAIW